MDSLTAMKESDARLFNQGRIVWRQLKRK